MKILFLLLLLPAIAWANGPKYSYSTPPGLDDELRNAYHDIQNVPNGTYKGANMTLGSVTVDSITVNYGFGNLLRLLQAPVFCTQTTLASTTSSSYADTNMTCTIVPSTSTSKVLIMATGSLSNNTAGVSSYAGFSGTANGELQGSGSFLQEATKLGNTSAPCTLIWLDSPATTTSQTYKVRIKNSDGVSTASFGDTNNKQTMTLFEIGTK